MTQTTIVAYEGKGLAAARPASLTLDPGAFGLYWATDTLTMTLWDGSWHTVGGGYSAGTPPVVVQSASNNNGTKSVTMGGAPTNGNLLVAMAFNPSTDTAGTGWTKQVSGEGVIGTDFAACYTKTAGAGESTTQSPLNTDPGGGVGCLIVWELSGAATGLIVSKSDSEQTGLGINGHAFPNVPNCICLAAAGLVSSSNNLVSLFNLTQDQALKTGTSRQIIGGHSTLASAPLAQLLATVSGTGTPSWNTMTALISS